MLYQDWIPTVLSIAGDASKAIMDIYDRKIYQVKEKSDTSPVTEADVCAHHIIQNGLLSIDPTIPLVSEEGEIALYEMRSRWSRYWLVDPLDGTREFIKGSGEFTVNIALIENHVPVVGVVAVPARAHFYWAIRGQGAYFKTGSDDPMTIHTNDVPFPGTPLRVAASRRLHQNTQADWIALMQRLGDPQLIYCGSAWKLCLVAKGDADLYPQLGPTSEWDTAAGQCILEAAGGQLIDFKGEPLRYNLKSTFENPGFYAISNSALIPVCCG